MQNDTKETMKETADCMDLKNIGQEAEEWEQDETKKDKEQQEERRKKEGKKEKRGESDVEKYPVRWKKSMSIKQREN